MTRAEVERILAPWFRRVEKLEERIANLEKVRLIDAKSFQAELRRVEVEQGGMFTYAPPRAYPSGWREDQVLAVPGGVYCDDDNERTIRYGDAATPFEVTPATGVQPQ